MASLDLKTQLSELQVKQAVLELELSRHKQSIQSLSTKLQGNPEHASVQVKYPKKKPAFHPSNEEIPLPVGPIHTDSSKPPSLPFAMIKDVCKPQSYEEESIPKAEKSEEKETAKPKKDMRRVEMDFGKVWFVRLGIVSLLTGLVFLSNFAYHNFIYKWGATPRLVSLYLLSALLIGLGHRFEKAKEATTNYGRVLAAGGIAMLYYASYGAHFLDRLKVIDSSVIGGIVLLASAGVCLGYALWKKSDSMAICSIALAFYSTSINQVGGFTFISGIMLTLTGVILLDRLKSAAIGFTTMLGCYLSFSFWQLFFNHSYRVSPHTSWYVLGYWILCTAVILKQRHSLKPLFSEAKLLSYASINNSLFIALSSINFHTHQLHSELWSIFASIGVSFIAISIYLQLRKNHPESLMHLYLGKGIALITLALCIKLTGASLAISLTVQAALAFVIGTRSNRDLLKIAGFLSLVLSFVVYLRGITEVNVLRHTILFALYLGIAAFLQLNTKSAKNELFQVSKNLLSLFSIICLVFLIHALEVEKLTNIFLYILAFSLSQLVRLQPVQRYLPSVLAKVGHLFTVLAIVLIFEQIEVGVTISVAMFLTLVLYFTAAVYLVVARKGKDESMNAELESFINNLYIVAPTALLFYTLGKVNDINLFLLVGSLLPMLYHWGYKKFKIDNLFLIGVASYAVPWALVVFSFFNRLSAWENTAYLSITQLGCASIPLVHYWFIKRGDLSLPSVFKAESKDSLLSLLFHAVPAIIVLNWQQDHFLLWSLSIAVTSVIYTIVGMKTKDQTFYWIGLIMYSFSLLETITMRDLHPQPEIVHYLIASVPFGVYMINRIYLQAKHSQEMNKGLAIAFSLIIWIVASQHIHASIGHSASSICWAITGLFVLSLGFTLKDIVFRSMAFIILAATIIHVYGVDVWKLGALLRIMSFITLGVVLLIIGYLYCHKVDANNEE